MGRERRKSFFKNIAIFATLIMTNYYLPWALLLPFVAGALLWERLIKKNAPAAAALAEEGLQPPANELNVGQEVQIVDPPVEPPSSRIERLLRREYILRLLDVLANDVSALELFPAECELLLQSLQNLCLFNCNGHYNVRSTVTAMMETRSLELVKKTLFMLMASEKINLIGNNSNDPQTG